MSKSGSPSGAGHPLERQDSSGVMDSLECLPDEIVVLIPGQRPPALCALMATCSRFRVLASDEAIWQACHEKRWRYGRPHEPPERGWRVDFRRRHRQDTAVLPLVQQLGASDQAAWRQLTSNQRLCERDGEVTAPARALPAQLGTAGAAAPARQLQLQLLYV